MDVQDIALLAQRCAVEVEVNMDDHVAAYNNTTHITDLSVTACVQQEAYPHVSLSADCTLTLEVEDCEGGV